MPAPPTTLIPHPLSAGSPPDWATAWGQDRYGPWVEFEVPSGADARVAQRLRWVPPGRFLMGSPESEKGRYDDEGPRHEVELTRGFWLFDTPCTQGLWEAVTGSNPSKFKDPARPVEQVSWEDVGEFLRKVNVLVPGLSLGLPTEAEWEYACRAGTSTSTYAGDVPLLGENNAPGLDRVAWYGGNSGHGWDRADGRDSSRWPEKQYPHAKAGTREVKLKEPSGWGLYDILGNVWEWCRDGARTYTREGVTDPVGPAVLGAGRVVRGGGWGYAARYARAASRYAFPPVLRYGGLGFRCLSSGGFCPEE